MQKVLMTVGCPGSGKTTFAQGYNPGSIVLSLDDFRTAFFRDKQFYHKNLRESPRMRSLLNDAYEDALRISLGYGFDVVLTNMHVYPNSFASTMAIIKRFGIVPELIVFKVPLLELFRRNETRPELDRVPDDFLRQTFDDMNAPEAWWRAHPIKTIVESALCVDEGCPQHGTPHVCVDPHEIAARRAGWTFTNDGAGGVFERNASDEPERVWLFGDWKELCKFAGIATSES